MNKLLTFILMISFLQIPTAFGIENLDYNYESINYIPIELSINKTISTKDEILEGTTLHFHAIKDVFYNGQKIVSKGEQIDGRVETIITSGMNGFPAEITLDNFEIPHLKQSKLLSNYTKIGQNRCFIVYPIKWSLTPIPFVGSLTNLIKGGHAKIKTSDIITIYYYPEWK